MMQSGVLSGLALLVVLTAGQAIAAQRAVVFPFELIDASLEGAMAGKRADETRRLELVTDELRRLMNGEQRYELRDLKAFATEIAQAAPLYKCNGCEVEIAKKAGADLAITGTVYKVSSLILNLTLYVREVENGKLPRVMSTDIRGNTDETWLRGIRWLAKNRLLVDRPPE
jgi:hypothetical protein